MGHAALSAAASGVVFSRCALDLTRWPAGSKLVDGYVERSATPLEG